MLNSLTPVFASSAKYLAPIMRGAMRDAIKHTTEAAIIFGSATVLATTGTGIYLGSRKVNRKFKNWRFEREMEKAKKIQDHKDAHAKIDQMMDRVKDRMGFNRPKAPVFTDLPVDPQPDPQPTPAE